MTENNEVESVKEFSIPIEDLKYAEIFQPRASICQDVVQQYKEWLDYSEPPPIEVYRGTLEGEEEAWWVISGHHRVAALLAAQRDTAVCFASAKTYEDAIWRASISNGSGQRSRQIYKMNHQEWAEACKKFLRISDRLSEEAIQEFLQQAVEITGKKTWKKINASAIAAVFGVSRGSVINYRAAIDLENECKEFPEGTRIVLVSYEEIHLLNERRFRLGFVQQSSSTALRVKFDYSRCKGGYFLPSDLKKTDDPPYEKPEFWKIGDRAWSLDKGDGIVVSVIPNKKYFSMKNVSERSPLIMWNDDGEHTCYSPFDIDYEGVVSEPPPIEELIQRIEKYLEKAEESYEKKFNENVLEYLKSFISVPSPPKFGNFADSQSQLPDKSGNYGKQPEDPKTTATNILERPADNLLPPKAQARLLAAQTVVANLKLDLEIIPIEDLKQINSAIIAELERRSQ